MLRVDNPAVLVAFVAVAGCTHEDASGPDVRTDAAIPALDSADSDICMSQDCRVWADYGDLGLIDGIANDIGGGSYLVWRAGVAGCGGDDQVLFMMDLIGGRGVLTGGVKTGTYMLGQDDFGMDTCGACIRLVADDATDDARCYATAGGTLNLTAVDDYLAGSVENVTFRGISCDDFSPLETECSTEIEFVAFEDGYSISE